VPSRYFVEGDETRDSRVMYTMRMKRTNLVLDSDLLDLATRSLGVKTYSAAVNLALAELIRVRKIQSLPQFFGHGLWQGNLGEMREDRGASRAPNHNERRGRGRRRARRA
jgi:Bacterial antitoxin of type II TA system, VapB